MLVAATRGSEMPIERQVDEAARITRLIVVGEVNAEEMRQAIEQFWEAPRLTQDVLWDYRQADMNKLRRNELEELVRVGLRYRHRHVERTGGKTAIVASSDLEYGMMRASATLTKMESYPFEVRTFRTVEEAEAWLAEGS
jgi:hypothetical protein